MNQQSDISDEMETLDPEGNYIPLLERSRSVSKMQKWYTNISFIGQEGKNQVGQSWTFVVKHKIIQNCV